MKITLQVNLKFSFCNQNFVNIKLTFCLLVFNLKLPSLTIDSGQYSGARCSKCFKRESLLEDSIC